MSQHKKNIILIGITLLLGISIFIVGYFDDDKSGLDVDKRLFTLADQTIITDVVIESRQFTNHLSYIEGQWVVNNKFPLDPNMRDVFFSVLSKMEIRTSIPQSMADSISSLLDKNGLHVTISNNNTPILSYIIGGKRSTQLTYIKGLIVNKPYQMHIPGYQSYIAGIFNVSENEWRSRFLFEGNLATLSSIELNYDTGENLTITYNKPFFKVNGVTADSVKITHYIEDAIYLQADSFFGARASDSLYSAVNDNFIPMYCTLIIRNASGRKESITVLQKPTSQLYYIVITPDLSFCRISSDRLNNIIKKQHDFE